jgi:hypothetical protein
MHSDKAIAKYLRVSPFEFRRFFVCLLGVNLGGFCRTGALPYIEHTIIAHETRGAASPMANLYDGFGTVLRIRTKSKIESAVFAHQKGVESVGKFINHFTSSGQLIVDLFGGGGTTLIACEQLKRQCYMMEIDPKVCDVIVKRWMEFTGEEALLERGGEQLDWSAAVMRSLDRA